MDNVKTDFIKHNYPLVLPPIIEEGITYLSKEDIAGMKLHAIIQSGKRLKDFIDIYFLLQHFSMNEMIDFFARKYSYSNPMMALKAVTYFDDIDEQIDPPRLPKLLPFAIIKRRILEAAARSYKKFLKENVPIFWRNGNPTLPLKHIINREPSIPPGCLAYEPKYAPSFPGLRFACKMYQ